MFTLLKFYTVQCFPIDDTAGSICSVKTPRERGTKGGEERSPGTIPKYLWTPKSIGLTQNTN